MAERWGFSLHAGVAAKASEREKLEHDSVSHRRVRPSERLPATDVPKRRAASADQSPKTLTDGHRAVTWAQHLKRVFRIDIETCRRCGGPLRVIARIEDPLVI